MGEELDQTGKELHQPPPSLIRMLGAHTEAQLSVYVIVCSTYAFDSTVANFSTYQILFIHVTLSKFFY